MTTEEVERTRVLLVADPGDPTEHLVETIRGGDPDRSLERVAGPEEALDLLEGSRFEVVLVDAETATDLGEIKDAADPASVVALVEDDATGRKTLSDGADDFLVRTDADDAAVERILRTSSDRARLARALARSEHRFARLVDAMEDGYFEVDLSGTFTMVNDHLCRFSGYDEEAFLGTSYTEFVDEDNANKLFNAFHVLYETGIPLKLLDFEAIRKDGERIPVETSVFLKRDDDGRKIGFWGILRDVSARKRAEEELAAYQEET